jgi:hypothetical protein
MQFALLAMMLVEMYAGQFFDISDVDDPKRQRYLGLYAQMRPVMEFLEKQEQPFRFEYVSEGQGLNVGAWYGLEQVDGFLASASADLYDFLRETDWVRGRMILNTVYTVAKQSQQPEQQLVYEDPHSDWKVYRNPQAGPRAWVQHTLDHIEQGAPAPQSCEGEERVHFTRPSVNEVVVEVQAACRGYVVVAEPWAEGWQAQVDGKPTPIYRYWNALRAVEVDEGISTVRFVYRPAPVYWGAALTGLGVILCAAAGVVLWRRSSSAEQASR